MANVVVGGGLDMADAQGQTGLGTFQRLALRLLIAAQHQRLLRWVEIQADDVPELFLEMRIVRQLEGAGQMRFDVVGGPQPLNACGRDARRVRHGAATPAPQLPRGASDCLQRLLDRHHRQRGLATSSRRIRQPGQSRFDETSAPMIDRHARDANRLANALLRAPIRRQQNDLRTLAVPHRHRAGTQPLVQFHRLFWFQLNARLRHDHPLEATLASSIGEVRIL